MNGLAVDPTRVDWHGKDRWGRERRFKGSIRDGVLVLTPRVRDWRDFVVWASGKSNYFISKLLNQLFNATSYSFPSTSYFALWTATLSATSTGATAGEAAYTGYARVAMTDNATNFSTSSSGSSTTNNVAITWGANSSGSEIETYIAILDSATVGAGNILYWGSISSTTIATGETPQINISGLTVSEA